MVIGKARIAVAVRNSLDEVAARARDRWNDTRWTRAVKTALCEASAAAYSKAGKHRLKIYANGVDVPVDGGEWMFDVTCLLYRPKTGHLRRTPLVAESEWGDKEAVADDFSKLLLARADVRVMVVDCGYWNGGKHAAAELAGYVRAYADTAPDDYYLLAAWGRDGFEYWIIRGTGNTHRMLRRRQTARTSAGIELAV